MSSLQSVYLYRINIYRILAVLIPEVSTERAAINICTRKKEKQIRKIIRPTATQRKAKIVCNNPKINKKLKPIETQKNMVERDLALCDFRAEKISIQVSSMKVCSIIKNNSLI